ncbi:uncharacterized protein FSUBG_2358 [Fusarium subglutinans]|uniref:Uncharacterized protein n=1 Tax=Gibberella subglutinans TaxID=42677 RepID=A0A8H5V7W8_GIBSU|nr:uncharacterized protein FSUBG_2358 [Fusarium subglutinans]KAF5611524.1 hypothetical protein FSUBG_2358 [Fusarium subglutinans]
MAEPSLLWRPDQPEVLQVKELMVDRVEEVAVSRLQLTELDNREFKTNAKFGSARFWDQVMKQHLYYVVGLETKIAKERAVTLWKEAAEARERFSSEKVPDHEMANVVWMENCKHIALKGTENLEAERLSILWEVMIPSELRKKTMASDNSVHHLSEGDFLSYLPLLGGYTKWEEKSLASTGNCI